MTSASHPRQCLRGCQSALASRGQCPHHRNSNGFRYTMRTKPDHQAGPVHLDRTDADIEFMGDQLVRLAGDDAFENLALPWAEGGHALGRSDSFVIPGLS